MTSSGPGRKQASDVWLAQTLQDAGVLVAAQADEVRKESDGGEAKSVWNRAVELGYTNDATIVQMLADRFKVKPANLDGADLRASALLPESVARKHKVIPLSADDRTITLATADPRDLELETTLGFVTGRRVSLQVAAPGAIDRKIDEAYRPEKSINMLLNGLN